MFGMYSSAGVSLRCEHPARSTGIASAARRSFAASGLRLPRTTRALDTENLYFHRAGLAQDSKDPVLVPLRSVLGHEEPEPVVGEIPVQNRPPEVRQAAGQEERREGHGASQQHTALEGHRDEGRQRYERLAADVDRPVERRGPDLERESQNSTAQPHDEGHVWNPGFP